MNRPPPTIAIAASCGAIPILIAVAVLLPFLGKPFTIDDVTFLLQAKHVLIDPLHPTAFDMVFHGERIRLSRDLATGPIMAYLLVPAINSDRAEYIAHGIQLGCLALTAVAPASRALRLQLDRAQAAVAAFLVVSSPAVLAMGSTAMPDVPTLAFATCGIERFLAWHRSRRSRAGVVAALFLALAILSRSHALAVIPIAGLLAFVIDGPAQDRAGRAHLQGLLPLFCSVIIVTLVMFVTRDPESGTSVAGATLSRMSSAAVMVNLPAFAIHWVVAFPLAVLWPAVRGRKFLMIRRTYASLGFAFVLAVTGGFFGFGLAWGVILLFLLTLGIDVLIDIGIDALSRNDKLQLVLLLWLLTPALAAVYVQLPAKLLLPAAPAMAMLVARKANWKDAGGPRVPLVVAAVISLTLSVLMLRADRALAEIGRLGGAVVAEHARVGENVWTDGAWGFQWYAMEAGAEPLARTGPFPMEGDVIVSSLQGYLISRLYPSATLLSRAVFNRPGGRIHGEGAGFYSNIRGPLPWTWGVDELGRVEAWRIGPKS